MNFYLPMFIALEYSQEFASRGPMNRDAEGVEGGLGRDSPLSRLECLGERHKLPQWNPKTDFGAF